VICASRPRQLASGQAALLRARGVPAVVVGEHEVRALADAGRCAQILDHLIDNAVQHGDAARRGVTVEVGVDHQGRAALRVRDRGPGVPGEQGRLVFEHGIRLRPERGGEGLGLPLSRALARQQGGDLVLEPPVAGAGACFSLLLPLADVVLREPLDEADDGGKVVEDEGRTSLLEGHGPPTDSFWAIVESQDDLGLDFGGGTRHDG
jgi:two-component system, sensor histidine kinase